MNKKQTIIITILVLSIFIIPSAYSKSENNPFSQILEALKNLDNRVTALESPTSGTILKFYEFSKPDEFSLPDTTSGWIENYQFAEFTITPSSPNNYVTRFRMSYEYLSTTEPYEPHMYIHVENEKGDEIYNTHYTFWAYDIWQATGSGGYGHEISPFETSRSNEQILVKLYMDYDGDNPIHFRNIKINLMVYDGIQ